MSVKLDYYVSIKKLAKGTSAFLAGFFTTQISWSSTPGEPLDNEVEVGSVFAAIRANKRFGVVIDGYPHAIHQLLAMPLHQAVLEVSITLHRTVEHRDLGTTFWDSENYGRFQRKQCSQSVANLALDKVELLSLRATKDETYTANFRVQGSVEVSYEPAAECEKWATL